MISEQEKIIKILSQKSMGAPFIFSPYIFKKGSANREPADLVWACNDCVLLFYMKSKLYNPGTADSVKYARKNNLIEGNLIQAKGWLSEWRNGRKLEGKNEFQEFSIDFLDYKNIIVIGVIDYGMEEGEYHLEWESQLGVKLCATLSQKLFKFLVDIDCTAFDFIFLISQLRNTSDKLESISLIYHKTLLNAAEQSVKLDFPQIILSEKKLFLSINTIFRSFRSAVSLSNEKKDNIAQMVSSVFNDIRLSDYYRLVYYLVYSVEFSSTDINKVPLFVQTLNNYIFIVGVIGHTSNLLFLGEKQFELLEKAREEYPSKTIVMIAYDNFLKNCSFSFDLRKNATNCKLLLDELTVEVSREGAKIYGR